MERVHLSGQNVEHRVPGDNRQRARPAEPRGDARREQGDSGGQLEQGVREIFGVSLQLELSKYQREMGFLI